MIEEKIKWNKKYKTLTPKRPSSLVDFIPQNSVKALDLGGGFGTNATLLANKGYDVTLIDISDTVISKITDKRIKTLCLDLDGYEIKEKYDVILMIKYFNLDILKQIPHSLNKRGYFVFETIEKYPVNKKLFFEIFKNFKTVYFCKKPFRYVGIKC